jgi:predicted phage-related endonuclease
MIQMTDKEIEWWVDWADKIEDQSGGKTSEEILGANKLEASKVLDKENEELVKRYMDIKRQIEILSAEEKNIKPDIISYLNESDYLLDRNGKIMMSYKSHTRTSFDSGLFKQENPDLYQRYSNKASEIRTLKIYQSKEF